MLAHPSQRTRRMGHPLFCGGVRVGHPPTDASKPPRRTAGGWSLPGPQKRGTGGTLIVIEYDHRDRGHPPRSGPTSAKRWR